RIAEGDDLNFIATLQRADEIDHRVLRVHELVALHHAAALVQQEDHADRRFLVAEVMDVLSDAILVDLELVWRQITGDLPVFMARSHAQANEIDSCPEAEASLIERRRRPL